MLLLVASAGLLHAAAPLNDNFPGTTVAGTNGTLANQTNEGAGKQSGEPAIFPNSNANTVWYSWTIPAGTVSLTIAPVGSGLKPHIAVYTGAQFSEFVLKGSSANGTVTFPTSAATLRIQIDGENVAPRGQFSLTYSITPASSGGGNTGTTVGGQAGTIVVGGLGPEPIACFRQNLGGGSDPVSVIFDPTCTYLPAPASSSQKLLYQSIWDFGDGSPPIAVPAAPSENPKAALSTVSHLFVSAAAATFTVSYRIDVTVVNTVDNTSQPGPSSIIGSTVQISSGNIAPAPVISNLSDAPSGALPYTLKISASDSRDPDGYILWAAIDWGDGTCELVAPTPPFKPVRTLEHIYNSPGIYTVVLTTIDNGRMAPGVILTPVPVCGDTASALAFITARQGSTDARIQPVLRQDSITLQVKPNLQVLKGKFLLGFGTTPTDKFDLLALVNVPPPSIVNVPVTVTIGSLTLANLKTDARGRINASGLRFDYKGKKRTLRLRVDRSKLNTALGVLISKTAIVNGTVDVPISVTIGTTTLAATARFVYTAPASGKGTGRDARSLY